MSLSHRLLALALDRSAAAAVEFAIIAVPLMLLLAGTAEIGRLFWTQHVIDEAAIAGARCMGIRAPHCTAEDSLDLEATQAHLRQEARLMWVGLKLADITVIEDAECGPAGSFSKIGIKHHFISVLPFLSERELQAEACFPNQP